VEIHISGPASLRTDRSPPSPLITENAASIAHKLNFTEDNLVDAHMPMQGEDYALLAWALEHAHPRAVSLEYFRQPEPLREQLVRWAACWDADVTCLDRPCRYGYGSARCFHSTGKRITMDKIRLAIVGCGGMEGAISWASRNLEQSA